MMYLYIGLGIAAFLIIGFFVSVPIVTNMCYKKFFGRRAATNNMSDAHYDAYRQDIYAAREKMEKLPFTELNIRAADGIQLFARYYDYGSDKTVVFLHGAYSHPFNNFAVTALRFAEWGFNILIPDMRAHGRSGGDWLTYGCRESEDVLQWIKLIAARYPAKIVLYGISMGAASIGMVSDRLPSEVCAAVYDCGYTSVSDLVKAINKRSHAPMFLFNRLGKRCRHELGVDLDESAIRHIKNTVVPSFFIHGTADVAVPCECSRLNYEACAAPKELLLVEGCGHTTAAVPSDAAQKIHNFINNYL